MAKKKKQPAIGWVTVQLPKPVHLRLKAAAAIAGKTIPQLAAELIEKHLPKVK